MGTLGGSGGKILQRIFLVLPLIYTLSDLWQNNLICDEVQTATGLSIDLIPLRTCTMPPNVGQDLWDPWIGAAPPAWTAGVMILLVTCMFVNMGAGSLRKCHKSRSLEECQKVFKSLTLKFVNLRVHIGKNILLQDVTFLTMASATSLPVWKVLRSV